MTRLTLNSSRLDWTPGANGTKQMLYVGADKTQVEGGCPGGVGAGTGCVVKEENLAVGLSTYTTGEVLVAGTVYFWRVVNYKNPGCQSASATKLSMSSCELSPPSLTLMVGESDTLTVSALSSTSISRVDFVAGSAAVSVNPGSDNSYVYQTSAAGVSPTEPGFTSVTSNVYLTGDVNPSCSDTSSILVTNPGPWWQVVDADVTAVGNLNSEVPAGDFFDLVGGGGFPGVPAYGGVTDLTSSAVSETGWLAQSLFTLRGKPYNYKYFHRLVPADTVLNSVSSTTVSGDFFASGGEASYGYYWYLFDGTAGIDLTIDSDMALGGRRVILLVDSANLNLQGNISLTDGEGFFLAIVGKSEGGIKGDIVIDPTVTSLEGFFLADATFSSGAGDTQLAVRGSVVGLEGIALQRDLGALNSTTPAEVFTFAPDFIFTFPSKLASQKMRWKEVVP